MRISANQYIELVDTKKECSSSVLTNMKLENKYIKTIF